jgi:transcriptional regulator with XRE-family HTH domain
VRASRHLTQAELAEITGIPQPSLSLYERDRRLPSIDIVNKILVGCGYLLEAVAGGERIACPLPRAGWYPDDAWRPDEDEPTVPPEPAAFGPDADPEARAKHLERVLALGDSMRAARAARRRWPPPAP